MSKPKLNLEQIYALLNKLENDDAFRALFQADPGAGLAQIGAPISAAGCYQVTSLASKLDIRAARLVLTRQLTCGAFIPHRLDTAYDPEMARMKKPEFSDVAVA